MTNFVQIGFSAHPTGGPGIFLSRLQAELERNGHFSATNPDVWLQLCYEALPEDITKRHQAGEFKLMVRTDGVYAQRYRWLKSISLPGIDNWYSGKKNKKRNRKIAENLVLADGIIYQSEFSRTVTHKFVTQTQPGHIIFNGIDTQTFKPTTRINRFPQSQSLHILVSHSFRPHKRLHESIRLTQALIRALPNVHVQLHVVGGDDGNCLKRAKAQVKSLNLKNQVIFHGKQPYEKLHTLYNTCDFMLGLSFWDFCPNVIIEGMSCGLPILGVNWGGIPELVGRAGILVNEELPLTYYELYDYDKLPRIDTVAYVDAALTLLENLGEYQTLARQRARDIFDITQCAKQYIAACESLVSQPQGGSAKAFPQAQQPLP